MSSETDRERRPNRYEQSNGRLRTAYCIPRTRRAGSGSSEHSPGRRHSFVSASHSPKSSPATCDLTSRRGWIGQPHVYRRRTRATSPLLLHQANESACANGLVLRLRDTRVRYASRRSARFFAWLSAGVAGFDLARHGLGACRSVGVLETDAPHPPSERGMPLGRVEVPGRC